MVLSEDTLCVGPLEIEAAAVALGDAEVSGDRFCVVPAPAGVLVAVIDGLGHGSEAAAASARACEVLTEATDRSLPDAFERCHTALRGTRGAVIALALFPRSSSDMQWLAVGNVEGLLLHRSTHGASCEAIVQRPGIVGHGLPHLMASTLAVAAGDTLVFATDGLERGLGQALSSGSVRPADGAGTLLRRFATGNDDALLLLARYVGETA
jgi:negative regulator of sigma-B (phosphoserine phosphatase)